jgi:hypothetical protein
VLDFVNQETIQQVLASLKEQQLDFDEMGSLMDYLGVHVGECDIPDSIELTQPELTKWIIEVIGLTSANSISTPAEKSLGICENDEPALGNFNYRSVVGIAMFLCNNTRLDCAMAVHQCARYSSNPKRTHEAALKRIGRYLVRTANRGLIIWPTTNLKVDCYVDADVAGVFNIEDANDPKSVRLRTGFMLTLGNAPILWKSKLQPLIALSMMEAEYIALSTALPSLLPVEAVLRTVTEALDITIPKTSTISTVWEENHDAEVLATTKPLRLTPQSKHIAIRYHWFCDKLEPGKIEIKPIASK